MTDSEGELPRDDQGWLLRRDVESMAKLTGDEDFTGVKGASVLGFWRFAMQDLQMNNTRGYLAEYLVGHVLGIDANRIEWDPYDLLWQRSANEAVRIEVKSSAYVQTWRQKKLSTPSFSGLKGRILDEETGQYSEEASYNADVYVMCLHGQREPLKFDPLDINDWKFYVVPRSVLVESNVSRVALRWLDQHGIEGVGITELKERIAQVWEEERVPGSPQDGSAGSDR